MNETKAVKRQLKFNPRMKHNENRTTDEGNAPRVAIPENIHNDADFALWKEQGQQIGIDRQGQPFGIWKKTETLQELSDRVHAGVEATVNRNQKGNAPRVPVCSAAMALPDFKSRLKHYRHCEDSRCKARSQAATQIQGKFNKSKKTKKPTSNQLLQQAAKRLADAYTDGRISMNELASIDGYTPLAAAYLLLNVATYLPDLHELELRLAIGKQITTI